MRWSDKQSNCLVFTNHLNPDPEISVTFGWVPWYLIVMLTYGFPFLTSLCVDALEPYYGHLTVSTCMFLKITKYNSSGVAATFDNIFHNRGIFYQKAIGFLRYIYLHLKFWDGEQSVNFIEFHDPCNTFSSRNLRNKNVFRELIFLEVEVKENLLNAFHYFRHTEVHNISPRNRTIWR